MAQQGGMRVPQSHSSLQGLQQLQAAELFAGMTTKGSSATHRYDDKGQDQALRHIEPLGEPLEAVILFPARAIEHRQVSVQATALARTHLHRSSGNRSKGVMPRAWDTQRQQLHLPQACGCSARAATG